MNARSGHAPFIVAAGSLLERDWPRRVDELPVLDPTRNPCDQAAFGSQALKDERAALAGRTSSRDDLVGAGGGPHPVAHSHRVQALAGEDVGQLPPDV